MVMVNLHRALSCGGPRFAPESTLEPIFLPIRVHAGVANHLARFLTVRYPAFAAMVMM